MQPAGTGTPGWRRNSKRRSKNLRDIRVRCLPSAGPGLVVDPLQLLQDRLTPDHHLVPLVRAPQADREHAALVDLLDDARRGDPVTRPDRGGELHLLAEVDTPGAELGQDPGEEARAVKTVGERAPARGHF